MDYSSINISQNFDYTFGGWLCVFGFVVALFFIREKIGQAKERNKRERDAAGAK